MFKPSVIPFWNVLENVLGYTTVNEFTFQEAIDLRVRLPVEQLNNGEGELPHKYLRGFVLVPHRKC
jgi:hypothetical protein